MYKGEIVHIVGAITSYLGELGQEEHPNGRHWLRINNPVVMRVKEGGVSLTKLGGIEDIYKPYVDIKLPPDVTFEVRVVDKAGELYERYTKEIKRKKSSLISMPAGAGLGAALS